jgi:hypothetical protein
VLPSGFVPARRSNVGLSRESTSKVPWWFIITDKN